MTSAPEFLNLFVQPTGELLYFLAVIALTQAALFMALGQRLRGKDEVAAGRYVVLMTATLVAWLAMGVGGLVALVTDTPADAILPPLERAVNLLVVIFTGAALLSADSTHAERRTWRTVGLLVAGTLAAYAYTAHAWHPLAADHDFNAHPLGYAWTFATGLALVGALILLLTRYRHTADIPLKVMFFGVLLSGYSYVLMRMSADALEGDTSGALRLAFLTAMPLLPIVVYRLVLERLNAAIDEVADYAEAISRPQPAVRPFESISSPASSPATPAPAPRSYVSRTESMTLLRAIGIMLEQEDPELIPRQIVKAIAEILKADIVALVRVEGDQWADMIAVYDLIQERLIPGLALNLEEQPTLLNAIERMTQRPLLLDRNMDELLDFYARLDIAQLGPAYIQPLVRARQVVGVVIVGLPYTNRPLTDHETTLLEGLAPVAARLFSLSRAALRARAESEGRAIQTLVEEGATETPNPEAALAVRQEMQASLELAQEQIAELSRMVRELQVELDFERSRLAQLLSDGDEAMTITQRIEVLSKERQELATERERLAKALQEAQAALVSATGTGDESIYTSMIEALRRERDELEAQKNKLEHQLQEIREAREAAVPGALREMLEELSEDKARLAAERDALRADLESVQEQLRALGIEGGVSAIAKTLARLTEERSYYKAQAEKIAQERDLLLAERRKLEDQLQREAEREAQIAALEADLRRLATDREALVKQRDTLRAERDELIKAREQWYDQRTRLIAEATVLQTEMDDALFELNRANAEKKKLSERISALEAERDRLRAEVTALKTERDQLLARAEGDRELLAQLGADGVGALQQMIEELTREREATERELARTRQQLEQLAHQSDRLPAEATQHTQPIAPANADVVLSIAQELRTPVSSIMGYTELLLNESVGILGALQRQFLERVQANLERLTQLINDLIKLTQLESEEFQLQPVTVDMLSVIEDAITAASARFKEKNITLQMDLTDTLPQVRADRDAMQQVLLQLLSNAYLASPTDSTVLITAREVRRFTPPVADEGGQHPPPLDGVLISITDQGGGVAPEDQPRVFGRLYRAENPLIAGIGDSGVGLSVAKTLVEAHGGAIWLESVPGKGSTFHFVVPLAAEKSTAKEA